MRSIEADDFGEYDFYKTVPEVLLKMATGEELDMKQATNIRDAHENEPKKYVIEKEGYSSIVVSMTKREAEIIEKFLEWAVIEDDFCITPVEDYVAVDWGGDE